MASTFLEIGNTINLALLRSPLHRLLSHSMIALNVTGRKSGRVYTFPVSYRQIDSKTLHVFTLQTRSWWRNLEGGAALTILYKGAAVSAQGEAITELETVGAALGGSRDPAGWVLVRITLDG